MGESQFFDRQFGFVWFYTVAGTVQCVNTIQQMT